MLRVLIAEYKKSLRLANKMKRELKNKNKPTLQDEEDNKIILGMISDLEYAIEWMMKGRNPDLRRGIDKAGVYLTDPAVLEALHVYDVDSYSDQPVDSIGITEKDRELIDDALCTLTEREKDVFMMIKVEGLTFESTADLLGIKKSTVQTHFERAECKIKKRKNESLFLVL